MKLLLLFCDDVLAGRKNYNANVDNNAAAATTTSQPTTTEAAAVIEQQTENNHRHNPTDDLNLLYSVISL